MGRVTQKQVESQSPIERGKFMAQMHLLDRRKDTAMSQLSSRLAVGSAREQVAARLLMDDPEGAALIAQRATDAAAYRLAMQGCGRTSTAPSCRALTVDTWARLDPEDARPWLQLMAEATGRRDDAAAEQALEQVLRRNKRSPTRTLVPAVMGAYASVEDAAGLALADRVGLPAEQRPYTRAQLNRGLQRLTEESMHVMSLDCAGLARTADFTAKLAQRNELQQVLELAAER